MKIFDCIMYFDEDFLLDLRFNILNNFVDYFVVVESNKTWQNNLKEFKFKLDNFIKFKDKIIYVRIDDMPEGENPWIRENYQRNCITRGLYQAQDNDLIIISDADEIPNPKQIINFNPLKKYAVFQQNFFYYKFNLLNLTYPNWYGSKICLKKYLISPQWLRNLKIKYRPFWRIDKINLKYVLENGGWHFCNLKKPKDLLYKYKNLCEYKDDYVFFNSIDNKYLDEKTIEDNIKNNKDLIGRKHTFKKIEIDESYPDYIINNQKLFKEWII